MSGHTPGPWRADDCDSIVSARGILAASDDLRAACWYVSDPVERRANALLMAAAPDLLEALKALTVWSENGEQLCFRSHNGIPMGLSEKQERLARAAIATAEGR